MRQAHSRVSSPARRAGEGRSASRPAGARAARKSQVPPAASRVSRAKRMTSAAVHPAWDWVMRPVRAHRAPATAGMVQGLRMGRQS